MGIPVLVRQHIFILGLCVCVCVCVCWEGGGGGGGVICDAIMLIMTSL